MSGKRHLSQHVDLVVKWLKWPAAVVALLLLPNSGSALVELVRQVVTYPKPILPVLVGLGGYIVLWWWLFRRPLLGTFLSTLEHELTHALFAVLTFHRVTGLRATWRSGGHVSYTGPGNWLITIAPYFFPTACLLILLISAFLPTELHSPVATLIGAAIGYHITSTYRETHAGQTDLKKTGWLFCVLFLPTANIVTYGVLVSYCYGGMPLLQAYGQSVFHW